MQEGWEALEHTADVGIRAWGPTPASCFRQAAKGTIELTGVWAEGVATTRLALDVGAPDVAALMVDWLEEILYLIDMNDVFVVDVEVEHAVTDSARGALAVRPRAGAPTDGTHVKAATYHRLVVEERENGWVAEVYLDV
ncbi:MAG TPA: archease [Actinomycetota bacterium]|nr:archease [Actinomycetota bacterium]